MRALVAITACFALAGVARADDVNANSDARAKVLFDEGKALMAEGQYGKACEKLDASFKLSRLSSTRGLLGACYEKINKLASAWVAYRDSAAIAEKQSNAERAQAARDKAAELFPKLALVSIDATAAIKTPGFTLTIDGVEQPVASLSSELPIDSGPHVVVADAPHYKPLQKTLDVLDGEKPKLVIEALVYDPTEEIVAKKKERSNKRKIIGLGLGAGGIAAVGVGVTFAIVARLQWNDAQDAGCTGDGRCPDPSSKRKVDDAARNANFATIVGIAGLVIGGAGLTLYLTAPKTETAPRITPAVSANSVGAVFEGRF